MLAVGQLVCLLVLLCGCALSQSNGGAPSSPCPNVFQYVYERGGVLQGRISIVPPLSFSKVKLQLQMTVTYYPLVAGVGEISLRGGEREIQEITDKAQRNEQQTIQFILKFPPGQPVPRMTQIVINGKDFCPNNIKYPDTRGSISLNYEITNTLPVAEVGGDQFHAPGTNPVYTAPARPAERPVQKPYEPQPIPTQFPSHVYHTHQTQSPYFEPESSTTRRPYVPPRTTQRPYVPPSTTQRPYEPPFRPSYESQTTIPKTPPKRPANNGQSEPRPGSQHRQCNVYPAEHVDCLKRCDQLEENHNARIQRRDSIKCVFPPDRPLPEAADIHSWIYNTLKIPKESVDTIQLQEELRVVYIKIKSEALLANDDIVKKFNGLAKYHHYNDVQLTYAGLGNRHVQVRNLPTEIENDKIWNRLTEYGAVHNLTDEFWTKEFEYNVKTGVRSVFIDLAKHIPLVVEIEEHNGLINYEGQPMKCPLDCDAVGNVDNRSGCQKNVPSYNTPSAL